MTLIYAHRHDKNIWRGGSVPGGNMLPFHFLFSLYVFQSLLYSPRLHLLDEISIIV